MLLPYLPLGHYAEFTMWYSSLNTNNAFTTAPEDEIAWSQRELTFQSYFKLSRATIVEGNERLTKPPGHKLIKRARTEKPQIKLDCPWKR